VSVIGEMGVSSMTSGLPADGADDPPLPEPEPPEPELPQAATVTTATAAAAMPFSILYFIA
jgi:hypothetical protein